MCAEKSNWDLLFGTIEELKSQYKSCSVKSAQDHSHNQEFHISKIEFTNSDPGSKKTIYDYGNFNLTKASISIGEGITCLENLRNGILPANGGEFTNNDVSLSKVFLASDSSYGLVKTMWPAHYFYFTLPSPKFSSVSSDSLPPQLKFPLYPTKEQAVIDFLGLNSTIDAKIVSLIAIVVPNFRYKIDELCMEGKRLSISVKSDNTHDLIGKFYCSKEGENGTSSPNVNVEDNKAKYDATFEPDYVRAVLIDSSGRFVDEKIFQRRHILSKGIVVKTSIEYINDLIINGENETTEFKSSNDKELLETIVSFANAKGGLIIVGVDDSGKINGYIFGLSDKKDLEKSIYGQVMNYCEPMIDIQLEWLPIDNKILLLIHVPEGVDKPYIHKKKGIYIRKHEHDIIMTRHDLDDIYRKKKRSNS